jgi:TRAP-type C4-dicarboxylate transport system permease small subunit
MTWFLALLLAAAVAFQIWVTVRLWRTDWFERAEKVAQSKLIWLLPILGAVMVYSVIADEEEPPRPTSYLKG